MAIHKKDKKSKYKVLTISGIFITIALCGLVVLRPHFLTLIDYKLYDSILRFLPEVKEKGFPIIVDIDEESLAHFGQWPWPRYKVSALLEKIKDLGAVSVGLDMIFPEPDRSSLTVIKKEYSGGFGIDIGFTGLPDGSGNNDRILAETLSSELFVTGYQFLFGEEGHKQKKNCVLHPLEVFWMSSSEEFSNNNTSLKASGVVCNLYELSRASRHSGFINSSTDIDGVVRKVPLILSYDDKIYPNLSFATLLTAIGENQIFIQTGKDGIESLKVGQLIIPTDVRGNLLVRYYKDENHFKSVSALSVMEGKKEASVIAGRIVLVGTSAAGLKDMRITPLNPKSSGVHIHANVIDNMLREEFLQTLPGARGLELFAVVISGLFCSLVLIRFRATLSFLLVGVLSVLELVGSGWFLRTDGIYISPVYPVITLVFIYMFLTVCKFRISEKALLRRTKELAKTQEATIEVMSTAIETRDDQTGGHIKRTKEYVIALARHLQSKKKYKDLLDDATIELMYMCAPLHDVGKIGVPDRVLLKNGKLSDDEFFEMRNHTSYGKFIIESAEGKIGQMEFLQMAKDMAYTHQEKWDGSGYPEKLKGDGIPLSGLIMAVADVYDALISRRVYKPGFSHEKAVLILREGKGTHFAPDVIDAFLEIEETFRQIAFEFADSDEDRELLKPLSKTNS